MVLNYIPVDLKKAPGKFGGIWFHLLIIMVIIISNKGSFRYKISNYVKSFSHVRITYERLHHHTQHTIACPFMLMCPIVINNELNGYNAHTVRLLSKNVNNKKIYF